MDLINCRLIDAFYHALGLDEMPVGDSNMNIYINSDINSNNNSDRGTALDGSGQYVILRNSDINSDVNT